MPRPFTLVLETSTPTASLLLAGPDGIVMEREFSSDRSHNAVLFGPLAEVLNAIRSDELGLVIVGSGPGSYSGTRVGIAAAQGVALAAGCPAVAVPSVLATPSAADGRTCTVVGDARRGSFWIATVESGRLGRGPDLIEGEVEFLAQVDGRATVTFETGKHSFPPGLEVCRETPTARLLWAAWVASDTEDRSKWTAEIPQPLYLRPPHITESKKPRAGRL